jgi:putative membrane-bound dehydrogenase-like protein
VSRLVFLAVIFLPVIVYAQTTAQPPAEAARTMVLPDGFQATVFAAEPAITQPMAFTFDDRGRLWVVECLSYPTWNSEGQGADRVTILEDTDSDGRHDKRTVFFDKGVNLSGIEVGFGGVWLTAVPNLIFIPDANSDDRPDGPPRVLLDGFDLKAKHNVVGNLAWGPDGWLYGCNGISSNSLVGKPGTPDERRIALNCSVWRYHPVRHDFDVYATGTTNPWGIDWDERGQLFITNCVIKHLFHVVPGGHYVRMYGQDLNPHVYGLIESCADHQHWAGGHWTTSRGGTGAHADAGGGHAHSGCMIYQGDNWPAEYRGNVFALNIHGQRLNRDVLKREGSGYVAQHASDLAFSKDPWFRGIHAKYGPDGAVYISDWSDIGECHDAKEEDCDKRGGRIYKIAYGQPRAGAVQDLKKLGTTELVALHTHENEWQVRHARRILHERYARGRESAAALRAVLDAFTELNQSGENRENATKQRLRLLLTGFVTGQFDDRFLALLATQAEDEEVRAIAIRLSVERQPGSPTVLEALEAAANDRSAFVRLHVASALQRAPLDQRWPIALALLNHAADSGDANLPLMYWYAVEPLVARTPRKAIELLAQTQIPLVRQYLARRIISVYEAAGGERGSSAWMLDELHRVLGTSDDLAREDILRGMFDSFRGRRSAPRPAHWPDHYRVLVNSPRQAVREGALELAVLYGDQEAIRTLTDVVLKRTPASAASRRRALALLVTRRDPELGRALLRMLPTDELKPDFLRALAAFALPEIPADLLALYPTLDTNERQDVIQTLTARPEFATALLGAIETGGVPRQEISALVIRQLQALGDKAVNERLTKIWGQVRPASADRQAKVAELKSRLTPEQLASADLVRGRALFTRSCATCHKLFGEGSAIGPELTGSQRANLDYILENVLDPSSLVPREYKVNVFQLADGRIVQGIVIQETPQVLTVQTPNQPVHLPVGDIDARKESPVSLMPEGLFAQLSPDEIRDLVAYLALPAPLPNPAGN